MKKLAFWIITVLIVGVILSFSSYFLGELALATGLLLIMTSASLPLVILTIYFMAKIDFLFTTVKENRAKIIIRGGEEGKFSHVIISKEGYHVDKETGDIVEGENLSWINKTIGAYWLGWPFVFKIYSYTQRWTTWKILEDEDGKGNYGSVTDTETLDTFLLADYPYYVEVADAECRDLIPLKFKIVVTAQCVNPYKTAFASKDWLRQMTALTESAVITFAGKFRYQDIIDREEGGEKGKEGGEEKEKDHRVLCEEEIKKKITETLLRSYGIQVNLVNVQEINPPPEMVELTLTGVTARLNAEKAKTEAGGLADAVKIGADAEVYRIKKIASADAASLKTRAKALKQLGDEGILLVGADAMPKLKDSDKIIFGGNILETALGLITPKKGDGK